MKRNPVVFLVVVALVAGCEGRMIGGPEPGTSDSGVRVPGVEQDGGPREANADRPDAPVDAAPTLADGGTLDADGGSDTMDAAIVSDAGGSDAGADTDAGTIVVAAGTGASLGVCRPSPCVSSTVPSWPSTNVVDMGNVDNGLAAERRYYAYYVPRNLVTDDPAHPPAAIFFVAGGGGASASSTIVPGDFDKSKLQAVADAHRLVVIVLMPPPASAGRTGWLHPQIDCSGGGPPASACGRSTSPSDEPYVKAAVLAATARFGIDPARRYAVGGSSGGAMTRDIECDASQTPSNSTLFRGFMWLGNGANAPMGGTAGVCPSGNVQAFTLIVMGKDSGQGPYLTRHLSDHDILGFDDSRAWFAGWLSGCAAAVHTTTPGSGAPVHDVYDYTCAHGATPQLEAVAVTRGGHTWCNLDDIQGTRCTTPDPDTNTWSTAEWMWRFFAGTRTR